MADLYRKVNAMALFALLFSLGGCGGCVREQTDASLAKSESSSTSEQSSSPAQSPEDEFEEQQSEDAAEQGQAEDASEGSQSENGSDSQSQSSGGNAGQSNQASNGQNTNPGPTKSVGNGGKNGSADGRFANAAQAAKYARDKIEQALKAESKGNYTEAYQSIVQAVAAASQYPSDATCSSLTKEASSNAKQLEQRLPKGSVSSRNFKKKALSEK